MESPFDVGKEIDPKRFEPLITGGYSVKSGDWVREGWALFKQKPGEFIGFTVLFAVITAIAGMIPFGNVIVGIPLGAGFYVYLFNMFKGRPAEFGDFFKGFYYFLAVILAGLLVTIFSTVGFLLLILPGIYLGVAYMFTTLLIVDKDMHFWQAMETSRRVITRQWWSVFGFALLLLLVNIVGALALLVGLLVSFPVSICATAVAYRDIIGLEPAAEASQQTV
jgi:uncharacterized membrane protein